MRLATIFFVALALIPGTSRSAVQRARYLMGTVCEVAVAGAPDADAKIEASFAEASRVEAMLSTWREESELSRVNRGEIEPSPELRALLEETLAWRTRTNGAFDPQLGRVIATHRVACRTDACWEEGAFGKGYALDRMLALLDGDEAMINFGGQIVARGELRVSIANPENREQPVVALTMRDASLSTSSSSEQRHIIDPRTRELLPPRGSATVLADDALTADILSTALYVMGEDDGLRWADANGVAAIFINPHRIVRRSARARERVRDLELLDRNYKLKD